MDGEGNVNSKINIIDLNYVGNNNLINLFESKAEKLKNNKTLKIDNAIKLKFYGLFKVATVGPINDKNRNKENFFDFTEKYKK